MKDLWLLIPFLSASIGWVIVRILVSMLFHPLKPVKFIGLTFHGFIFRRRMELSGKLAELAGKELFSFEEMEQTITAKENLQKILPQVEVHIDHFLTVKLKEKMPMVGMFVGERTLAQLKEIFMEELETLFPIIMRSYVAGLTNDFNLEQMITERLSSIPDNKISAYISQLASKQLTFLPFVGAFIGFLVGCINIFIILFLYK